MFDYTFYNAEGVIQFTYSGTNLEGQLLLYPTLDYLEGVYPSKDYIIINGEAVLKPIS